MADLPSGTLYGTVVGQFIQAVADSVDPGRDPDSLPIQGSLTFTPSAPRVALPGVIPNPVTMFQKPITAALDAEGYLVGVDGVRGIKLIASDSPGNPTNFTYTVVLNLVGVDAPSFSFFLPSETTIDLTTVIPVDPSGGSYQSYDAATAAVVRDENSETHSALATAIADGVSATPAVSPHSPAHIDAPTFVRQNVPLVTHTATGLPTIYWPYLVNMTGIAGALGKYHLYYSTDHDAAGTGTGFNGKGGIGMAYADDILGPWIVHKSGGNPVVYQDTVSGDQTETPCVILSGDADYPVYIYYQQQGTGVLQSTLLLKSKTGVLNDPNNVRVGIVIQGDASRPGDGQTTYTSVYRLGASWIALHLFGGGDYGTGGISYSRDGINWRTDPRRTFAKDYSTDPGMKISLSRLMLFTWRGALWALTTWGAYSSGFWTGDRPWALVQPTSDYRALRGNPLPVAVALATGETESVSPTGVLAEGGKVYAVYRSNGQYGSIRVAIAEA
jgi:hypothetical protein